MLKRLVKLDMKRKNKQDISSKKGERQQPSVWNVTELYRKRLAFQKKCKTNSKILAIKQVILR